MISHCTYGVVVKSLGSGATKLESLSCVGGWRWTGGVILFGLTVFVCKVCLIQAPASEGCDEDQVTSSV